MMCSQVQLLLMASFSFVMMMEVSSIPHKRTPTEYLPAEPMKDKVSTSLQKFTMVGGTALQGLSCCRIWLSWSCWRPCPRWCLRRERCSSCLPRMRRKLESGRWWCGARSLFPRESARQAAAPSSGNLTPPANARGFFGFTFSVFRINRSILQCKCLIFTYKNVFDVKNAFLTIKILTYKTTHLHFFTKNVKTVIFICPTYFSIIWKQNKWWQNRWAKV